jgi:hypothetical protein
MKYPSHQRRTSLSPLDLDLLAERWKTQIVAMLTAHTRAEFEQSDFNADELLKPILSTPVAQVRAFYQMLREKLMADPKVPFYVWKGFDGFVTDILERAPDQGVKRLNTGLAKRIAALAKEAVTPQIGTALVNALKWRDGDTLEKIAGALEGGERPRLRGRESCLFLCVAGEKVML